MTERDDEVVNFCFTLEGLGKTTNYSIKVVGVSDATRTGQFPPQERTG